MTDRQAATVPWDTADIHRLIRSGDFASARDRIETALTGNPHHVQARMMRVRLALAEGDLEDAARQSSTLLRAHPDNGWIVLLRVEAMAATGQPDAAIDTLVEHLTPEIAQHPSLVQTVDGLITKERSLAIRAHLIRRLTPVAAASPAGSPTGRPWSAECRMPKRCWAWPNGMDPCRSRRPRCGPRC